MAIREGAWDCPHCGRKRNRGPEKYCGGCGAPRGEDVKFYLPPDSPEVTEADALRRAQAGPDWTCSFCEADNPSDHAFCSSCGAARDAAAQARPIVEHRKDAAPPPPAPPPAPPPGNPKLKRGCQIGCLGLAALFVLFWFLNRPREAVLTVTGHQWERTVAVEELRTVTEEGWEGELPGSARTLSSSREIHHHNKVRIGTETRTRTVTERVQTGTERVKVGERDLGNGYFEDIYEDRPVYEERESEETYEEPVFREDPVYRMRYRYEVDKWMPSREAKAGAQDMAPRWPDTGPRTKEREGKREEVYEVLFEDSDGAGRVYRARDEVEWRGFEPGSAYRAKVKRDGEIVEILGPA
ncbi:MAG TPA: zinc ribbon domain-containing protein [Thermoanaerobaculia bacterium]|nr:zinc ribbon domain-containing protein [Thermoanaerobaculia bacterium]